MSFRPDTTAALDRIARDRQRKHRVPGLYAGVLRGGEIAWGLGVGAADVDDLDTAPGPDDQFLIASNSKTFTAVLVLQLRDEGRLALDDPLDKHLPSVTHPGVTIRSLLSHVSGMQREPVGDVWDTLVNPDRDELLDGFNEAARVDTPHHVFHYSNLAFAVLGELVAQLDGRTWEQSLRARLLDPLGMRRTSVGFDGRHVHGYFVPPYNDVPISEPVPQFNAMAPCGGLASTAEDLARWSAFVADPPAEVLAPDTLEEMLQPQILTDTVRWGGSIGLGFMVLRSGERLYAGHTGGMPGHISGLFTERATGTGALALMNSSAAPDPAAFAMELADTASDREPAPEPAWRPGTAVPPALVGVLGLWFSEGRPFVFSVREGVLEARADGAPDWQPPAVFERVGEDVYRTVSGRERGELLQLTRDAPAQDGRVTRMRWATYPVTREPLAFGQ
ncbi:serine hydrolase domain-containing protein [uncultured Jatrophihabitans sp.]|uniref:serine hydrolase domain-containing protein n=1 Tax=uncultured Jatrophihabitans sp. TaxID=1610747 RepID=UPI0035CB5AC1